MRTIRAVFLSMLVITMKTYATSCNNEQRKTADALLQLAKKAEQRNHLQRAVYLVKKSTQHCASYDNWYLLGEWKKELGQLESAKNAYLTAMQLTTNQQQQAFSIARYGEVLFMDSQIASATYAVQRATTLVADPPDWIIHLATQFEKHLVKKTVNRGYQSIETIEEGEIRETYARDFSKKILHIVEAIGGDVKEAFDIMAQQGYQQYGENNYRQYEHYLNDILVLKKSLADGESLFIDQGLVKTVDILLKKFRENNQSLMQTFETIKTTRETLENIGLSDHSVAATESHLAMVDAAGGIDNLNSMITHYQKSIYGNVSVEFNDTMIQLREAVRSQLLTINLNIDSFSSPQAFYQHFDRIKTSLQPLELLRFLQAGKALTLLKQQEKNSLDIMVKTWLPTEPLNKSLIQLIDNVDNMHTQLLELQQQLQQNLDDDHIQKTVSDVRKYYKRMSKKLINIQQQINHNLVKANHLAETVTVESALD